MKADFNFITNPIARLSQNSMGIRFTIELANHENVMNK